MNAHAEGHNNIHAKIIFIIDANPVISTIHTLDIFHRTDFIQFIRLHDFVECKCTNISFEKRINFEGMFSTLYSPTCSIP